MGDHGRDMTPQTVVERRQGDTRRAVRRTAASAEFFSRSIVRLATAPNASRIAVSRSRVRAVRCSAASASASGRTSTSPNCRHIVFTRCCPKISGYSLWIMNADGTNLHKLTSENVPPSVDGPSDNLPQVFPDGTSIAYHRNVVDTRNAADLGNRIVVVNINGGNPRDLTDPASATTVSVFVSGSRYKLRQIRWRFIDRASMGYPPAAGFPLPAGRRPEPPFEHVPFAPGGVIVKLVACTVPEAFGAPVARKHWPT